MHIVIIPPAFPSPEQPVTGIFFRQQAQALSRAGHRVGVLHVCLPSLKALLQRKAAVRFGIHAETDCGVRTCRYRGCAFLHYNRLNTLLWVRAGLRLFDYYRRRYGLPDVVHVHNAFPSGLVGLRLKKRFGVPVVLSEHSSAFGRRLFKPWQIASAREALVHADARVAVSRALVRVVHGSTDLPFSCIPNLVDTDFFRPERQTAASAEKADQPFRFLTVASLVHNKGIDLLLKAFARAFRATAVELWIGGVGDERTRLESLAEELCVQGRTTFLGLLNREQVRSALQSCGAFVLPSRYETFGVVLIEALACGLPVIATRCGGPEDIVHEGNGLLIPPDNEALLADALREIVGRYETFDPRAIRRDCVSRFSAPVVVGRLEEVYHSVAGAGSA